MEKIKYYKEPKNTFCLSDTVKTLTLWDVFADAIDIVTTGNPNDKWQEWRDPINEKYSVFCKAIYRSKSKMVSTRGGGYLEGHIAIVKKNNKTSTNAIARVDFKAKEFGFCGNEEMYCEKFEELYNKFKSATKEELKLTIVDEYYKSKGAVIIANTK